MNNAQRRTKARRERMEPETYVRLHNLRGFVYRMPLRYLAPDERADYLRRATSPL